MIMIPSYPRHVGGVPIETAVHAWESRPWMQEQATDQAQRRAMLKRVRDGGAVFVPPTIIRPRQQAMLHNFQQGQFGRRRAQLGAAPDADFSSVVLLMHFNGTNGGTTFTDNSSYARTVTNSGASTQTGTVKYGSAAADFSGSGNFVSVADATEMRMGTSDFTIEGWFYTTINQAEQFWYHKGINTTGGLLFSCGGNLIFRANGTNDLSSGSGIGTGSGPWYFISFDREGTTRRIYRDGVQVNSGTLSFNNSDTVAVPIGSISAISAGSRFRGYIDDLRITKGVCRHPGGTTYTPPSAAFPDS